MREILLKYLKTSLNIVSIIVILALLVIVTKAKINGNEVKVAGDTETTIVAEKITVTDATTATTTYFLAEVDTEKIVEAEITTIPETTKEEITQEESVYVSQVEVPQVQSTVLGKTSEVDLSYFNNTVFLGDSRTVGMKNNGLIKQSNTFAINGISHMTFLTQTFTDSVTGITSDIFEILSVRQPERVYIALGVNGVAFMNSSEFIKSYKQLIDKIKESTPNSIVVLMSINPVRQEETFSNKNLNNTTIDNMNVLMLQMAMDKDIYYLDVSTVLKDENGLLKAEYDVGDGLHYNKTGYTKVYDYICNHAVYK